MCFLEPWATESRAERATLATLLGENDWILHRPFGRLRANMPFPRDIIRERAAHLAQSGVYLGTSSWKYRGWCGQLYDEARYVHRGKFAESRFERNCLTEYAEVFKTVCVDATYYTFPRPEYLQGLAAPVPSDFQFGFKVTDAITVRKFPNLPRFAAKAGQPNPDFLNADFFASAFLRPCETIRDKVGVIMLEFSRFHSGDYAHGRDFLAGLDRFLSALPHGWPIAIEMRNKYWLGPEYFACLAPQETVPYPDEDETPYHPSPTSQLAQLLGYALFLNPIELQRHEHTPKSWPARSANTPDSALRCRLSRWRHTRKRLEGSRKSSTEFIGDWGKFLRPIFRRTRRG